VRPLALLTSLVVLWGAQAAQANETIRVAVGRFPDPFVITGELVVTGEDGRELARGKRVAVRAAGGLVVDGKAYRGDIARVRSASQLALAGHSYRNELELRFRKYDGRPEVLVVHPLDVETYVTGIVSSELPRGWPLATYQAQAVAARTFAMWQKYRRLDLPYHMESSVLDQVYGGAEREHDLARQAASSTRGLVLTSHRHLAQAYFHASCGGKTESAREGWGTELPYLPGSTCGACGDANRYRWSASLSLADARKAFRKLLGADLESIEIETKTRTGRVKTAKLKGHGKTKSVSGGDLRRVLGYNALFSTAIDSLAVEGDRIVIKGRGSGHGVGLCQWGARGLALRGDSFEQILTRYYPGARLMPLY
jgi:stage II sporulation protein D